MNEAAPSRPLLAVRDLTVSLPKGGQRAHAVDGVSFEIAHEEILCVVGESGSGKSLTAAAIMGLLPRSVRVTGGAIALDGEPLLGLSERAMRAKRGREIGMIFQEPMTALNPLMRVGDQIAEVLAEHGEPAGSARAARVMELLRAVNLPQPELLKDAYPFRLSGGQRQRVMIAIALAMDPKLLVADEPTTALDVTTQKQILALIRRLQAERRMGVLFITHDFGVVAEIAHRVAVMQDGRIVEIGSKDQVLRAPQHPYTAKLVAAVPRLDPPRSVPGDRPILIEVRGLARTFRTGGGLFRPGRVVPAVKGVDLAIREGETLGVVGESGSGKSTLGRLIMRLVRADGGAVAFRGADLLAARGQQLRALRREVQMVFQDPYASLNPRRKVASILIDGPMANGKSRSEALRRARELLQLVSMDETALDRFPHEFSGGQRQRIGIARALTLDPKLLVADEPVSALDVSVQAQVLDLLRTVREKLRLSMLFITHDLRVAAQVCDRIAVMRQGEIVETGATAEVFQNPCHAYTRELLNAVPGKAWFAG